MGKLKFDITGDNSNVLKAFRGVQDGVRQTAQVVEEQGQSIENVFNRIKGVASVAFAGFTAKEIVSTLASVRGEFQQLEIAFGTMLGSEQKATALMSDLTKLAATTPFDMKGVASGAKSLLAYGFTAEEVTDTMRRLGDICAGLGLNLQDMAWLFGTTRVQGRLFTQDFRQFTGRGIPLADELAKQFGVTKDKVQELVTAGKVGFPEVQKAIESMTNEGGKFGGLMEKQSHSITGQISNIEDTIEMAINDVGKQTEGIMNDALSVTSTLIDHWKEIGEVILTAASSIGLYKAMAVGVASFQTASTQVGYEAELSALEAILPLKEQKKQSDLEEAVSAGTLSQAQAELVAEKRKEAEAYVLSLQEEAKAALDAHNAAITKVVGIEEELETADEKVDSLQELYDAAVGLGDVTKAETLEEQLNTASSERNIIAKKLQTAQEEVVATRKTADTAATTANTAQQELNTASTVKDTAAKGIWAQVTLLCKRAQDAWNTSMFSSPLFWIAAAIAGATYAIYKLVTAETAHEAAIRKSNEAWDEYNKKVEERQSSIEGLIRTIQSETASEFQKAEAYDRLKKEMPEFTDKYDQASIAAMDFGKAQKDVANSFDEAKFEKAKKDVEEYTKLVEQFSVVQPGESIGETLFRTQQLNEAVESLEQAKNVYNQMLEIRLQAEENSKPLTVRLEEAQQNETVRQKIFDFYDEAITLANDWQGANDTVNFATGESKLDEFIAKAETDLADLRKRIKANPADMSLQLEEQEKTKVLQHLQDMKTDWNTTGATTIPLLFKADWQSAQSSLQQAKDKVGALANSGALVSYQQAYNDAVKAYNTAKKKVADMEASKGKYTESDYTTATTDLKAAKDRLSKLGGDPDGKTASKTENKQKQARQKRQKAEEDAGKQLLSLQQKNADDELAIQKDSTEKKLKEIENDYKKREAEIDKQEKEFKKKNKEAGKKEDLTEEQKTAITTARDLNTKERDKKKTDLTKEQQEAELASRIAFLSEYGTLEQKKVAVTEEANEKIRKINEDGTLTSTDKDYQIKSIQAGLQQSLNDLNLEDLKKNLDWDYIFSDMEQGTPEVLAHVKTQLEQFRDAAKDLTPEQIKTVTDALTELQDKMDLSTPIQTIKTARAEYKTAKAAYDKYAKAYEEAQKAGDTEGMSKAYKGMITEGKKMDKSNNTVKKSTEELASELNDLGSGLSSLGDQIGGTAGQLLSLGGSAVTSFSSMVTGVKSFKAATDTLSKTVAVLAIIQAAFTAVTAIISAFSNEDKSLEKYVETMDTYIDLLSDSISDLNDEMSDTKNTMSDTISYYEKLKKLRAEEADAIKAQNQTWLESGKSSGFFGIGAKSSQGEKIGENIKDMLNSSNSDTVDFTKKGLTSLYGYLEKTGVTVSKYLKNFWSSDIRWDDKWEENMGDMSWIWKLSDEDLKAISEDATIMSLLGDTMSTAIKEYVEAKEAAEDDASAFGSALLDVSFDDLYDSFSDLIKDMDNTSADFADNFSEYMYNALVKSMVAAKYKDKLQEIYDMAVSYANEGTLEDHLDELKKQWSDTANAAQEEAQALKEVTGYTGTSSQSASSGGWESMGQETADELNGRFTALQIAGESIANNMAETITQMQSIVALGISTNGAVLDMRNMMVMTNSYLEDMVKYSKLTYTDFGTKLDAVYTRLKEI